jgi:hypothetical protein
MSLQSLVSLFSTRKANLFFALVVTAFVCRDAALILSDSRAIGIDSYYYILQADSLRTIGHAYFSTHFPIVLYVLAILSYLIPNTILALKIGSLLLESLLYVGISSLVLVSTRSRGLAALAVIVTGISNLHFYMLTEFINHLGGLVFLVGCALCAIKANHSCKRSWRYLAFACLITATFSHRSILSISIILFACVALIRMLLVEQRYVRYFAVPIALAIWILPFAIASGRLCDEATKVCGALSSSIQSPFESIGKPELLALAVLAPLNLAGVLSAQRLTHSRMWCYIFGSVALWSLLLTLNPFLNREHGWSGVAGRLTGMAFLQLGILLPGAIFVFRRSRVLTLSVIGLGVAFLIFRGQSPIPVGMRPEYLSKRQELIEVLSSHQEELRSKPMIIAAHGDEFMITSLFGVESQHTGLPNASPGGDSAYWLIKGLPPQYTSPSMTILGTSLDGTHIVLVADRDLWSQTVIRSMTGFEWQEFLSMNPHLREHFRILTSTTNAKSLQEVTDQSEHTRSQSDPPSISYERKSSNLPVTFTSPYEFSCAAAPKTNRFGQAILRIQELSDVPAMRHHVPRRSGGKRRVRAKPTNLQMIDQPLIPELNS